MRVGRSPARALIPKHGLARTRLGLGAPACHAEPIRCNQGKLREASLPSERDPLLRSGCQAEGVARMTSESILALPALGSQEEHFHAECSEASWPDE